MFQAEDDGKCPDQACRRPLSENDYILGFCPRCEGLLPAHIMRSHSEKIEKQRQVEDNSKKLPVPL